MISSALKKHGRLKENILHSCYLQNNALSCCTQVMLDSDVLTQLKPPVEYCWARTLPLVTLLHHPHPPLLQLAGRQPHHFLKLLNKQYCRITSFASLLLLPQSISPNIFLLFNTEDWQQCICKWSGTNTYNNICTNNIDQLNSLALGDFAQLQVCTVL